MRIIIFNQSTMCFNHIQKSSIVLRIHKNEKYFITFVLSKHFRNKAKKLRSNELH